VHQAGILRLSTEAVREIIANKNVAFTFDESSIFLTVIAGA
jgi:hypothetical protein